MAMDKFEQQTLDILCCFFDEPYLETDSGNNDFDPMKIANQLRLLGDHYDETVIQPLLSKVQKASPEQAGAEFTNSVKSLFDMWVTKSPEIVPEKHLLKAMMVLSLYVKKQCPNMTTIVRVATANIINNKLRNWIMLQGGWEQASSLGE